MNLIGFRACFALCTSDRCLYNLCGTDALTDTSWNAQINKPHLAYTILGGFTSVFMLVSLFIKEKLYIGEASRCS